MLPTRKADDDKLWNGAIGAISRTLNQLDEQFRLAFAEGHTYPSKETEPNEKLKLNLYEDYRRKLFKNPAKFDSIQELDEYYLKRQSDGYIDKFIDKFRDRKSSQDIINRHQLPYVISNRKVIVLQKLAGLYHALASTGFVLHQLNKYPSAIDCMERVNFLFEEYQLNAGLVSEQSKQAHRQTFVDPLKVVNTHLIEVIRNKKYGEIAARGILQLERDADNADRVYCLSEKLLLGLPAVDEVYAVVQQKAADTAHQLGHTLEDYALGIQAVCDAIQPVEALRMVSCQQQKVFADKLLSLREIEIKELSNKQLEEMIGLCVRLRSALDQLNKAILELEEHCELQVNPVKKLAHPQIPNVWMLAKEGASQRIHYIINLAVEASEKYKPVLERYKQVCDGHQHLAAQFESGQQFVLEWERVNQQSGVVVLEAMRLLGGVLNAVQVLSAVPVNEFPAYMKRHWPEYTVALTAGAGGSALVCWLMAFTVLAPVVAVPALGVSVLAAAGVSKLRDAFSPPGATPADLACQSLQAQVVAMKAIEPVPVQQPLPDKPAESTSIFRWMPGYSFFAGNAAPAPSVNEESAPLLAKQEGP